MSFNCLLINLLYVTYSTQKPLEACNLAQEDQGIYELNNIASHKMKYSIDKNLENLLVMRGYYEEDKPLGRIRLEQNFEGWVAFGQVKEQGVPSGRNES